MSFVTTKVCVIRYNSKCTEGTDSKYYNVRLIRLYENGRIHLLHSRLLIVQHFVDSKSVEFLKCQTIGIVWYILALGALNRDFHTKIKLL